MWTQRHTEETACDHEAEAGGMHPRAGKHQGAGHLAVRALGGGLLLQTSEGAGPSLFSDFLPPELEDNKFQVF